VIRSSNGNTMYDIVFTPSEQDNFSRPQIESMDEESLQADLLTIEDFFAHFQGGIISRIEEASSRLVENEDSKEEDNCKTIFPT